MVDIFALALSHGLLALAAWRLLLRPDLDEERAGAKGAKEGTGRAGSRRTARTVRREVKREGVRWKGGAGEDA